MEKTRYTLLNPYGEDFPRPKPFMDDLMEDLRELADVGVAFFLKAAEIYDAEMEKRK